ncbi:hypothetical protein CAter282_1752 [Collimonas arenae]|uniref:Uncharacterized protein n=1 Tax=Collimonas arenae TaxID=279058 RepID=A0A127PPE8_9BURK|nr:hypothetical protein CAter10_1887 [Collimonas arenae]AMP09531.1 hypothetical protein CAter282_1752 [Collimonas arenae]
MAILADLVISDTALVSGAAALQEIFLMRVMFFFSNYLLIRDIKT